MSLKANSLPSAAAVAQAVPSPDAAAGAMASNPLMAKYLTALKTNPLATKQMTSGVLSALAEVLAGHFAGLPPSSTAKTMPPAQVDGLSALVQQPLRFTKALLEPLGINDRAIKMFIYGWAVSAPLGHVLVGTLQKAFAGRTSTRDKILQIVVSQLTVTVISNVVYLSSMAIVNGARSLDKIQAVLKAGLWRMLQVSWVTSPLAIAFAQKYLAPDLWEPAFTVLRFFMAVYFNTLAKRKQVALAKQEVLKKRAADAAAAKSKAGAGASVAGSKPKVEAGGEEVARRAQEEAKDA